jgi:hypothetical protein
MRYKYLPWRDTREDRGRCLYVCMVCTSHPCYYYVQTVCDDVVCGYFVQGSQVCEVPYR